MENIDDIHSVREQQKEKNQRKLFILRNVLNLIFMLVATVGLIWYFVGDKNTGLIIIICSIPLKMTSTALRFLKP